MSIKKKYFCFLILSYAVLAVQSVLCAQAKGSGFASIQTKTLTLAEGAKWYYKVFDDFGRPSFAVLYEHDKEREATLWRYSGASVFPSEQIIRTDTGTKKTVYTDTGKVFITETYDQDNTLLSKVENAYDSNDNLITQTIQHGTGTEKSVWRFVQDKAVSETKYYDGKKTAFIELGTDKRIVHIYKNDKEVFVTEEE